MNDHQEPDEPTFRGIKHVDPYGRFSLGRRRAFTSYAVEENLDGVLTLTPVIIFEKKRYERWCRQTNRVPAPGEGPIVRIPTERF